MASNLNVLSYIPFLFFVTVISGCSGNSFLSKSSPSLTSPSAPVLSSSLPELNNATEIPVVVTFEADVTGFTQEDIEVVNGSASAFSGTGREYTFKVIPENDGTVAISVPAGAAKNLLEVESLESNVLNFTIDSLAPSVTGSLGLPADGVYEANKNWVFQVNFTEAVKITGAPRLVLNVGSTTRYADYLSGDNTTTLLFRYTTQSGDNDSDGVAVTPSIDVNGGTIRDAANNSASLSFAAPNTSNVKVSTLCPANYIEVAALSPYTTNTFCVAKYEMKNVNGVATSQAAEIPWLNISRNDSITACSSLGEKYSLISNAQWQTIARNLEGVAWNWSNGTIGHEGGMSGGHSDNIPANPLAAASDDNDSCSGTGQTCDLSTWSNQRRVFKLASGAYIWDFSGNLREWLVDTNSTNFGTSVWLSTLTAATHPTNGSIGGVTNNAKYHFGPAGDYTALSTVPYGGLGYGALASTAGAISRGGWHGGANSGVFGAYLNDGPTSPKAAGGFRCVWQP